MEQLPREAKHEGERSGPASMAASYLNIAQLLGKARGWGLLEEESWVCFPQILLATGKKSCWLCCSKALGFSEMQLLEVRSSVLPANSACPLSAGLYTVGNDLNVCTGGDSILLFTEPLLFPPDLSLPSLGSKWTWQMWSVSLHCRPGKVLSASWVSAGSGWAILM